MRLVFLLACLGVSLAQADPRGDDIATLADRQLHGHGDSEAHLVMTLVSPRGETATRVLRVRSREQGGAERTLMIFDTPRDVAGTALLSESAPQATDTQWLYLPAVKRVKQIGARNRSGPFMASEFAFEDIATPYPQKYEHRWLRDETRDGLDCHVLERRPRDPDSGYSRQVVWIDREQKLIRRIEFFDRRDALLKVYTAGGFQRQQGRFWRPAGMLMVNVQTGRQTRMDWSGFRFGIGLPENDFTQNALLRVK
jgi:outer membrane lipoprotein-sorting protein